ncbi:PTS sugar transporter subunit IIA [Alteromonas sp. a30]|uniref:PTS sugar transporter subunit IIA n=1 Tax=Alteromonas sp. a30 TaxID=2730917 RepID=UPI002281BD74|nr:PTS glucose transporter subunit IIA [Alteromonas sp. a30]MCY7296363.1 PTS glucose transporter subunit IIA [Alteromonas sp. a30]
MSLYGCLLSSAPSHFKKQLRIASPLSGRVRALDDIPLLIHQERLLGEGVAIEPTGYQVFAPFQCRIEELSKTGEHIKLRSTQGLILLIQIGVNAARLHGEGFKFYAKQGDVLQAGQKLLEFNPNTLKLKADSTLCSVTLLNSDKVLGIEPHYRQSLAMEDALFSIYL